MMTAFALLALSIVGAGFALWPLLGNRVAPMRVGREDSAIGRLELQQETLLTNLADLEFEHQMGKLSSDDYGPMRESLSQQAMAIMEKLDVLRQVGVTNPVAKSSSFAVK